MSEKPSKPDSIPTGAGTCAGPRAGIEQRIRKINLASSRGQFCDRPCLAIQGPQVVAQSIAEFAETAIGQPAFAESYVANPFIEAAGISLGDLTFAA